MRPRHDAALALAAFALAFGLRAGTAVLTEFKPLFPDYYYNDARMYDAAARKVLAAWESGSREAFLGPGTEAYSLWVAALYKAALPALIVPKLVNALLGALCAVVWSAAAAVLFGRRAGLLTALLSAAWPSHVFFTAQNFKEAPGLLLLALVLASWVFALRARAPAPRAAALLCGAVATALSAFLRPHLSAFYLLAAAAGGAALLARRGRAAAKTAAALLVAAAAGGLLYRGARTSLTPLLHGTETGVPAVVRPVDSTQRPGSEVRPDSPRGISEYRQVRMHGSRVWSRETSHREIETEFFPEARFESWWDIAAFLPKASFYELFMPLPGLYPLAAKPGRILAAGENLAVLLAFLAAAAGFWRERRRPGAWVLAAFVVCVTPAAALFEFDLGSASRHRLQPLSAAVPLAAVWAVRRLKRAR